MRLIFDVWVIDNWAVKYSMEQETMFETVYKFIYDKVFHLMPYIDQVESEDDTACIMPELLKGRIGFHKYGVELERELLDCFDEKSTAELAIRFKEAFSYLN